MDIGFKILSILVPSGASLELSMGAKKVERSRQTLEEGRSTITGIPIIATSQRVAIRESSQQATHSRRSGR